MCVRSISGGGGGIKQILKYKINELEMFLIIKMLWNITMESRK